MERGPNGMSILALDESYCQHDCPRLVEHGSCVIGDRSAGNELPAAGDKSLGQTGAYASRYPLSWGCGC